jgi:hypothetical protein
MRNTLIALTIAGAAFGAHGFATAPASAAPLAPAHLAAHGGNHVEQVRHVRRHDRRHVRRDFRRHFWAAGPWAFGGLAAHNCFRIRHGFVCYF